MLARAALHARFAFPDPLPCAADSAPDCSLHRSLSVANDAAYSPKTAQTSPIITPNEAKAKDATFGGFVISTCLFLVPYSYASAFIEAERRGI